MNKSLKVFQVGSVSLSVLLSVSFLTGCATTSLTGQGSSHFERSNVQSPESWDTLGISVQPPEALPLSLADVGAEVNWLDAFDDPAFNALVEEAYRNNPNLERLQANLDRAKALADRARSSLSPTLDGGLSGSRSDAFEGPDRSSANLDVRLSASWDVDLWGRLSASAEAGELEAQATQADLDAARQILAASVIETLFLAIEAQRLQEVSQRNLDALSETLGFVEVQYDRGLRSAQELVLIRADVSSAIASYKQAEGRTRQAKRALEILIGHYPRTDRGLADELPDVPSVASVGQPANILRTRPDLRAAERRVDAAYARHASALAAKKPRLSLSGSLGGSGSQLADWFDPASIAASLLGNVTAPLFDGGLRDADIAIAKADVDAAMATYRETALDAFLEVENQLDEADILRQREAALLSALKDARDALRFTQFRYESAEVDLLNVLQVQQRVSFIEAQLVGLRRARLSQYLNLSLALGIPPQLSS